MDSGERFRCPECEGWIEAEAAYHGARRYELTGSPECECCGGSGVVYESDYANWCKARDAADRECQEAAE